MVKTLHPLGLLSSRIGLSQASRVRVEHDAARLGTASAGLSDDAHAAAATREAWQAPLDFPPLAQATVPGDRLAIAVDESVPLAAGVVRGMIDAAAEAGISTDEISVVTTDTELAASLRAELNGASGKSVQVVIHDPDNQNDLCPIGQTRDGQWLRINRTLFEADVVLPIGCARLPGTSDGVSVYDSVFPRFSDTATIARLRKSSQRESPERQAAARRQAEEAGWMLGMPLVMEVVPGSDGSVAAVVAGESAAVAAHCLEHCRRLWSYRVSRRASLVIATITGGPIEQRWTNVARALAAAEQVVEDGGAVAICSDLDTPPSRSLARHFGNEDWARVERDAANDNSADGVAAWRLARALQRGPVYFLSQLEADAVEELGLAPVANLEELQRLAQRHDSCLVVDDSQYVAMTVTGES